jgi:SAM-dependent methyltransferase
VGLDPSPALLVRARELSIDRPQISYHLGNARALPFSENSFEVVVFHTALCHIPDPQQALAEAFRVLVAGGVLAVFDANYADTTLTTDTADPLQTCAVAAVSAIAFDPSLLSRLQTIAKLAGFKRRCFHRYVYDGAHPPDYMLTIVDRGADAMANSGQVGHELCSALKAEARRRVQAGEFFGQITYGSLIARKPGTSSSNKRIYRKKARTA